MEKPDHVGSELNQFHEREGTKSDRERERERVREV